ncbi:hypothetical protein TNCV_1558071 [Trichonephila clavipes]|uniref:Uncharacterized protein n=1 Tax=Trichonephila clavipes TaxID=2585209 RepID=A0A8X6RA77_TRICX|nr:hypothetical protein TNCV_1558071 [Trichonephila clavipes]
MVPDVAAGSITARCRIRLSSWAVVQRGGACDDAMVARGMRLCYNVNALHVLSPPTSDVNFPQFACFLHDVAFSVTNSV